MDLSAGEVWREVRGHGDAIIAIRKELDEEVRQGDDRETRIRKLELRYYAILAGLVTGFLGYAATLARGVLVK
jgi:hypothetical protein